ncbi:MAG: VWA domain-containing protein [Polyangiales bacterium]
MEFLGVSPDRLLPLFGVAAAAVVALYILKLRRRRLVVPFAKLWDRVLDERPSSALFKHLRRVLSLLLQLLLLALLVFALSDPRRVGATGQGRTRVVLLDASASMKATDVPGSRAEAARRAARDLVRALGAADRALLASMDAEVTALAPMSDDPTTLETALRGYAPRDTGLDLPRALRFAGDALRGAPTPEVVIIGDGDYQLPPDALGGVPVRFVGVGRRSRNVGVAAFSVRRYPLDKSRYEVLAEVRSWSSQPERVELTLLADGAPVEVTTLSLAPGASAQRVLPDLSGANGSLEARVRLADGGRDDLPADDHAWATLPPRRRARVLSVSRGNRYLEAALLLDEYLDVTECAPEEAPARLRAGRFDVAVLDGVSLPLPAGTHGIWLRPQGPDAPLAHDEGFAMAPPGSAIAFDEIQRRHPVMRFTSDLEEAHVGRIVRYRPTPADAVLGRSAVGPLLIAGERGGQRFVLLSFDPRESDVPLLISWPVILLNSIDWFAGEDPAYLSSFRTGTAWRVPVPAGVQRATVETPSGRRVTVPVHEGRAVFFGTEAGLHRVHAGDAHTLIAANLFEPAESRCGHTATLTLGGAQLRAPTPGRAGVRRELWIYLLAGALAILAVEWVTWHRRVTV